MSADGEVTVDRAPVRCGFAYRRCDAEREEVHCSIGDLFFRFEASGPVQSRWPALCTNGLGGID